MARNQKLINYHTGKKDAMPKLNEVDYGEIVVRHNEETPELLIKVSESSFGVFQASGAVQTAINTAVSTAQSTLNTKISDLQTSLTGHVADFKQFKTDVEGTYATKTELEATSGSIISDYTTAIGAAKKAVYDSATSFTTKEVNTLSTTISEVRSDLNELSGVVESISTNIGENYVSKADFEEAQGKLFTSATTVASDDATAKANKAKEDAISAAAASATTLLGLVDAVDDKVDADVKALADYKAEVSNTYATKTGVTSDIATAKSDAIAAAAASADTLNTSIETVDGKVDTLSGNVENLKTDLTNTINEKVARAYRYQGSCTYAELPESGSVIGEVWNVTDANDNYPAGTNYAWNGTEWDALGGSVDLSPYATSATVKTEISDLKSAIDSVSSATKTLVSDVSAATKATYATKTELEATSGSIITAYNTAISNAKLEAIGTASGYTDGQISAVETAYKQADKDLDARIDKLEAISADTQSAVQSVVVANTEANKITATKTDEGNVVTLNFDNMVIDCGDF